METHDNSPHSVTTPPQGAQIEAERLLNTSDTMKLPPTASDTRDRLQSQSINVAMNLDDQKPSASLSDTKKSEEVTSLQVATASLLSIHKELKTDAVRAPPSVPGSSIASDVASASSMKVAPRTAVNPSSPTLVWKDLTVPETADSKAQTRTRFRQETLQKAQETLSSRRLHRSLDICRARGLFARVGSLRARVETCRRRHSHSNVGPSPIARPKVLC